MSKNKPIIIAMVGNVGSGKSYVARYLASLIGAAVIDEDDVRVRLRNENKGYEKADELSLDAAGKTLLRGTSVVLAADHVEKEKRALVEKMARGMSVKVSYIRIYADRDVVIERLLRASYPPTGLFRNATEAIREMWRRTPHHYSWSPKNGGTFTLKKLPIKFSATVDATNPEEWPEMVKRIAEKITT